MSIIHCLARFRAMEARRREGHDAGFTLVEMLTVMLIMGILTAAVSTMMISGLRTADTASAVTDQTNQARVAMDSISRALRTAVLPVQLQAACDADGTCAAAFVKGTPTFVRFYADLDNTDNPNKAPTNNYGPRLVTFELTADGRLMQTIQKPDAHAPGDFNYQWTDCTLGAPGCAKSVRMIAQNVQSSPTRPLFTYYGYDGVTTIPTPITDAAHLAQVASVDVVVTVSEPGRIGGTHPVTFVQRMPLPNVNTMIRATASPSA